MSRYRMSDGAVVDTDNASRSWKEGTRWDGRNRVSLATGDQWVHETLYRSRKGRYYTEHVSQWQGSTPSAEWVSKEEAACWLLTNEYDPNDADAWPADLRDIVDKVSE